MANDFKSKMTIEPNANLFNKGVDTGEKVQNVPLTALHDFPNHPFKVTIDEDLQSMADDIEENGVRQPIIARRRDDGGYEIIAGHRRRKACELVGIAEIPTIVKDLSDDEAIIIMCSTNFHQRKTLLPSEKAFAYKMQLEAMKRQGKRTDLTFGQIDQKLNSRNELAEQTGENTRQIHRYIRLTYLIPPLLDLVDKNILRLNPAVSLSYLDTELEQPLIVEQIKYENIPTVDQAYRLKELSEKEGLNEDNVAEIMDNGEERIHEHYSIPTGSVKKYFPPEMKPKEVSALIIEIVEKWWKHQQAKNQAQQKSDIQDER